MSESKCGDHDRKTERRADGVHRTIAPVAVLLHVVGEEVVIGGEGLWRCGDGGFWHAD